MVSLVAVPVVAEAEVAAVLADEAEVALLPFGLGLGLGLALAHRPRHAPTRAATGPRGLPLPHPARRLRDGTGRRRAKPAGEFRDRGAIKVWVEGESRKYLLPEGILAMRAAVEW